VIKPGSSAYAFYDGLGLRDGKETRGGGLRRVLKERGRGRR